MRTDLMIIFISLFGVALFAFIIVIIVLSLKRMNVRLSKVIDGHNVEISTGYSFARLAVDGKVVDEMNSFQLYSAKLVGKAGDVDILVNIGVGAWIGRRITTFVGNEKDNELSN